MAVPEHQPNARVWRQGRPGAAAWRAGRGHRRAKGTRQAGGGGAAGPNKGLEPTAPRAVLWPAGIIHGAAAQAWRSASTPGLSLSTHKVST